MKLEKRTSQVGGQCMAVTYPYTDPVTSRCTNVGCDVLVTALIDDNNVVIIELPLGHICATHASQLQL